MTAVPLFILANLRADDLAIYGGAMSMAAAISIPLLSPVADRMARKPLLLVGTFGLVVASIARLALSIQGELSLGVLIACDALGAVAFGLVQPALQALASALVVPDRVPDLMARQRTAEQVARFVAPAACGVLVAANGVTAGFACVTLLFTIAGVLFAAVPADLPPAPRPRTLASWAQDLRAGFRIKLEIPAERQQSIAGFAVGAATLPLVGIALPLLAQSNDRSADDLGYLQAAFALGGVLGFSFLGPRLRRRFNDLRVATGALPVTAVGLAMLPIFPSLFVQLGCSALVGAALAVYQVAAQANRLLATPAWFRGRMAALNVFLGQAGMVVGAWLAATSQGWLGAAGPFLASAALLLSIAAWLRTDRHVAGVLASDPAAVEGLYGRTHPALFK